MEKLKCIIIDDERLAQELLESYIQKIPNLELVGSFSLATEAIEVLSNQSVDVMFLDIEMPDLSGLEFLRSLPEKPATILTTAYSEYAIEGYELEVIDYLLKPIAFNRFFKSITKVVNMLKGPQYIDETIGQPVNSGENYFFVKSDNKIIHIAFEEVLFIEALQKYIRIYTLKEKVVTLISLSKIQEQLPSNNFVRIHRSFIVNVDKLNNIEGNFVRINDHQIPISKGQKESFMDVIRKKGLFN